MNPDSVFRDDLDRLERRLAVPYPDRALLVEELDADLNEAYREACKRGLSRDAARREALQALALDESAVRNLESLHSPAVLRALNRLPRPARQWLESIATAAPLAAAVGFVIVEVPVNTFIRDGGDSMTLVILLGSLGLFLELQRFFVWFVLRDHSVPALRKNTTTPLYLAAATFLLGVLGTTLRYYEVLARYPFGTNAPEIMRRSLREPLANMIMASSLAALTVLVHGALSVGLRAIRVPEAKYRDDP